MTTYKRICIADWSLEDCEGNRVDLKRGNEYITTATDAGNVTVFTNFWIRAPVVIFAGEQRFT